MEWPYNISTGSVVARPVRLDPPELASFPGFLSDGVVDVIALVGLGSAILTLIAFVVGIKQLRLARKQLEKQTDAVTAANEAATRVAGEARRQYRSHVNVSARRTFGYLRQHVQDLQWELAYRRAGDLAELLAQLADDAPDAELAPLLAELRSWDSELRRQQPDRPLGPKQRRKDWDEFAEQMAAALDRGVRPLDSLGDEPAKINQETP